MCTDCREWMIEWSLSDDAHGKAPEPLLTGASRRPCERKGPVWAARFAARFPSPAPGRHSLLLSPAQALTLTAAILLA